MMVYMSAFQTLRCIQITWDLLTCRCWLSNSGAGPRVMTPSTVAHQAPLSREFSRQAYWSWLPFPTPEDLTDSGIKLQSLMSPSAWQADSLPLCYLGSLRQYATIYQSDTFIPTYCSGVSFDLLE